jgi:hypothetical protein
MSKQYIRDDWYSPPPAGIKKGDYVVATKYRDGDPGDQFCIGFYDSSFNDGVGVRHMVVDNGGKQFRRNGFRRIAKVGARRGTWMANHVALFEKMMDRYSVWHWYRAPWRELNAVDARRVVLSFPGDPDLELGG